MKIGQVSNYNFTSRITPEDEKVTIIHDYKNALEKATAKVDFFGEGVKPNSRTNQFLKKGNKLKTFFQKDGKTPSYTLELSSTNKKIRSTFFDIDGKTKLLETLYDKLGNAVKSLYYKNDGATVFMEKIHQLAKK